jgi:hypothetical protein
MFISNADEDDVSRRSAARISKLKFGQRLIHGNVDVPAFITPDRAAKAALHIMPSSRGRKSVNSGQ